jgi:hypothetical protein
MLSLVTPGEVEAEERERSDNEEEVTEEEGGGSYHLEAHLPGRGVQSQAPTPSWGSCLCGRGRKYSSPPPLSPRDWGRTARAPGGGQRPGEAGRGHLRVAFLSDTSRDRDGGGIVATNFDSPHPPWPGADIDSVGEELDGDGGARLVVRPHRTEDTHQLHILTSMHTEIGLTVRETRVRDEREEEGRRTHRGSDGEGSDVEGVAEVTGDPGGIETDELLDTGEEAFLVESRHSHPAHGGVHAVHVHVGAEETDLLLRVCVALHALEALEGGGEAGSERNTKREREEGCTSIP